MAELQKALASVIVPHARCAHSTKRRVVQCGMHDHIIDRHAARQRMVQHPVALGLIGAKVIQRQRTITRVDLRDRVLYVLEAAHHHGRAEDLLLRNLCVG
ncbi:hypothetical protein SDC9_155813 [bioreactor metagenome]|uniref:Uncharacterized protein n=1 Tax=bioreactor metagenome TaxID=1076179 RepID=A0A645F3V5_9ZZZZ